MNSNQTLTPFGVQSLLGHRQHSLRLLRRPDYIGLCKERRPALKRELISIQQRLGKAVGA